MSFSATSAAMKAYEKELGYKLPSASGAVRAAGKACLYGGRSETYFVGDTRQIPQDGELILFDVKAQYARIMSQETFPDFRESYVTKEPKEARYIAWAEVEVDGDLGISPLPVHFVSGVRHADKRGRILQPERGSLLFPVGDLRGAWCDVDLSYPGIKVKKYSKVLNFPLPGISFSGFIDRFIPHKDSEVARAIKKNIYTSFSGKFSQSNKRTMLLRNNPSSLRPEDYRTGIFFGDWVLVERSTPYPRFSNYVWTAYCNAYGRRQQWQLFEKVAEQSGRLLHANTDSALALMPSRRHGKRVLESFPGKLTIKHKDAAKILSDKAYMTLSGGVWEVTASGIPSKVSGSLENAGDQVFAEIPDTFMQALRRGAVDVEIKNTWRIKKFTYSQSKRLGRIPCRDGWTKPFRLPL